MESEYTFMRQLSVFAGGWTLEAAQAICNGNILELTSALVKKSFIVVNQKPGHETRYSFHEMVHKYAQSKLSEAGEEEMIRNRHLHYFLEFIGRLEPMVYGSDQVAWMVRLFSERDNIRAALQWAAMTNVKAGLYLSGRLQAFWENCDLQEDKRWLLMV